MRKDGNRQKILDTLEQSWKHTSGKEVTIVTGQGSDFQSNPKRKGKAKFISQRLSLALVDIAETQEQKKRFWAMYHCMNRLTETENRVHGIYCKNRLCPLCQANRKANIINTYSPILTQWEEAYFVTLTIKACNKKKLKLMMAKMIQGWKLMKDRIRKKYEFEFIGVRSLECNYNPVKRTYNPHFHLIVPSKEIADVLIDEWLIQWNPKNWEGVKYAIKRSQDLRPVIDVQRDMIETIKYGAKIFTDPTVTKRKGNSKSFMVYAKALYNIDEAFSGHRLFDRFGFNLPKKNNVEHSQTYIATQFCKYIYSHKHQLWVNPETGKPLLDYCPDSILSFIMENGIDIESD